MSEPHSMAPADGTPRVLRWAPFGVLVLFAVAFSIHAVFFDATGDSPVEPGEAPAAASERPDLEPPAAAVEPPASPSSASAAATMAPAPRPLPSTSAVPARESIGPPAGSVPADLRGATAVDTSDFEPLGERRFVSTTIEGTVFVDGRPAGKGYRVVLRDLSEGTTLESVPTGARGAYTVDVDPGNRYLPIQVVSPDGRRLDSDPATVPFSISNGERVTLNILALDKKPAAAAAPAPTPASEAAAAVWGRIEHPVLGGPAVDHRLVLEAVPGGSRSYSAPSAADGSYELTVLPGRYKVVAVQGPEGALWWLADSAPFYLSPGQRLRFEALQYRR